jgi:hypothetical protein
VLPAPTPSAPPSTVYLTSVEPVSGSGNGWPSAFLRAFTRAARTGFTRDSERGSGWLNKPREALPPDLVYEPPSLPAETAAPYRPPALKNVVGSALTSAIGKQIEVLSASNGSDIDMVFASLAQKPVDTLLIAPAILFTNRSVQLVTLATYHRMPAIFFRREAVEVGGLMSYGTSFTDAYRQAGIYTARILKGEKPSELPVLRSTKFEFVLNLNTARAFGLTFPPGLLAIADEVIE